MRYAFMSFSCPKADLDEMVALAVRYGYDGIEPRAGSGHAHGIELGLPSRAREAIRARMSDGPTALCCLAVGCRFADPDTAAEQVEETRRYIDLAADVGAPRLRVFGGRIPAGRSREAAIDDVAVALGRLAGHAAERGVTVCLETHDDWCAPDHVAAVMERVDHAAVGVNWDVLHPLRTAGWPLERAHRTLSPWIRHTHVHDASLEKGAIGYLPMGSGGVDHREVLAILQRAGYDGYLSGEWINWEAAAVHLPRELRILKEYEDVIDG